jgi:nucleoside-diphosphate-sugar epimerase
MKILIAGGCGYIGSSLTNKLLERGYEVTVLDLIWFGNFLQKEIQVIKKNIFDLTTKDLKTYDTVVFLAGLSNDPMAEYSPSLNFIYNSAAPSYLAYICKNSNIKRFIYASSCSVYGYTVNELYDESSPTISNYPYGISKLQGEQGVLGMIKENFSVICLRQGTVCGISPRMRFDLVINTMFKTAIKDKIIIINNPSIWRPILNIKDAVDAYIRAIEASEPISGIFNIASGNYTVGELADIVYNTLNSISGLKPKLEIKHKADLRNYKVSIEKAKKILSYKPKHDVEDIVRNLYDKYGDFKDFDNPQYYNIEIFKKINISF